MIIPNRYLFIHLWKILLIPFLFSLPLSAKPYVMGDLRCQLGNQLFQVAATCSIAWDNGARPIFPDLVELDEYDLPINHKKILFRLDTSKPDVPYEYFYYDPAWPYNPITYKPNMRLGGYFQCERYFRHHKEEICELFAPSPEIMDYLTKNYGWIINHPKTVSIHVRTYFKEDAGHTNFCLNGVDYVEKAIKHFPPDSFFIVFSDNIAWCQENLKILARYVYFVVGEPHYHDFYLMSLCKHNIISNSTFSWWAAYLNQNPHKKIIAPQNWFSHPGELQSKDMIPSEWVLIK
jgi:Glycosyl transferase family 11